MRGREAVVILTLLSVSCVPRPPPPPPWPPATSRTWPELRRSLESERESRPADAWAAGLRITMADPVTGRVVDGRGAIAVAPGRAVRMILVGGAGSTVLDAWVTRARWRVAVPPLDLVRRGRLEDPRDMPIGFLRWWFLTPLTGTLFAAALVGGGTSWLLRDGSAVIELRRDACSRGSLLAATRRAPGSVQSVSECRERADPRPGDWARYADEVRGLRVNVVLESVAATPPDAAAFVDPDAPDARAPAGGT
jgi:hypothetical protein